LATPPERLSVLQQLTTALARVRTTREIAEVIIDQGLPLLQAEVGVVAVSSEDGAWLRNVVFKGVSEATEAEWLEYSVDSPVPVAEAARRRQPVLVRTVEERDRLYPVLARVHGVAEGGAVCAFPLLLDSRLLGVLAFCFPGARPFDEDEQAFLQTLADQCAVAVERLTLYERLQEEARRKDEFLAMLAHELRNPLGPIRHAIEVMGSSGLDPQSARLRDIIDRQSAHMARLVDELLDLSRLTRQRLELHKVPLDLCALVQETVQDHRSAMERAGLTLVTELERGPLWVEADPTRLSQALSNLLHNSQKFTPPPGRVEVTLRQEGSRALVRVADTGIGIPRELLPRLFEPFSQGDRSLDRSRGGLGLGLALVSGLVTRHGGTVKAESEGEGKGARLSLWLPLLPREAGALAGTDAPRLVQAPSGAGQRVLLIEDNLDGAETLRLMLERGGYEVRVAHDGPQGLALARTWPSDVVICDIGLPGGMDGYAVARALREQRGPRVLVAVSGYGRAEDKARAQEAGFDVHLTKPVGWARLSEALGVRGLR
jgi:signal transduction histidine kinase